MATSIRRLNHLPLASEIPLWVQNLVAAYGEAKPAGDYLVGLALEKAEGLHVWTDGALVWQEPAGENLHVEIAVRDAADGRFVPGLTVHISIADAKGGQLVACELPFLWHPTLYHYGWNVQVSAEREITILTRISPPTFARHDKVNGCRYLSPVEASFGPIGLGFLSDGRMATDASLSEVPKDAAEMKVPVANLSFAN